MPLLNHQEQLESRLHLHLQQTLQRLLDSPSKRAKSNLERKALNPLSPGESSHIERKEKERRAEALTLTAFPSHKRVKRGLRGSRRERGEKTVFNR